MNNIKHDGWCPKFFWRANRPYLGPWAFYRTRKELINSYEKNMPGWWEKHRKAGDVQAVKVRMVEVR